MRKAWIPLALVAIVIALALCALQQGDEPPGPAPEPPPAPVDEPEEPDPPAPSRPRTRTDPAKSKAPAAEAAAEKSAPKPKVRGSIRGRVVDTQGAAFPGALVWVDGPTPTPGFAMSDDRGFYRLLTVAGRRELSARGSGTATTRLEVDVPADRYVSAPDLVLGEGGAIRGTVVDHRNRPVVAARVRTWAEEGDPVEFLRRGKRFVIGGDDVITDEDGTFVLKGLESVPHRVYVDTSMDPTKRAEPPEVLGVHPDGDALFFRLMPKTTLEGTVIDAETRAPVTRFWVNGEEVRDPAGRFIGSGDETGRLEIRARGYLVAVREGLAAAGGDRASGLVIELAPDPDTGTLALELLTPDGGPVRSFKLSGTGPDLYTWSENVEDGDGTVNVDGIKAGTHTVWVRGEGVAIAELQVTVPKGKETRKSLTLARGGAMQLSILGEDERPLRQTEVELLDADGKGVTFRWQYDRPQGTLLAIVEWWGSGRQRLSETKGRLTGLAAGRYTLRVHTGRKPREFEIEIPVSGEVERILR